MVARLLPELTPINTNEIHSNFLSYFWPNLPSSGNKFLYSVFGIYFQTDYFPADCGREIASSEKLLISERLNVTQQASLFDPTLQYFSQSREKKK